MLDDAFGRRWWLWIASHGETAGMRTDRAGTAIRGLVWAAANAAQDRYARAPATLLEIHAALTGRAFSRADRTPVSGSAWQMWERISEALERATSSGRLRIELGAERHAMLAVDDVPDTVREPEPPLPSVLAPAKVSDWVGVVARDSDGRPLANVRCRITAPGRPPLDATTDADGRMLLSGIEIGSCTIEFPEVDAHEWAAQ